MKHIAVIKNKPVFSGKRSTPDGAINGNGDLAVILGNSPSGMRIYISKCDLWYASETFKKGGIKPLGYIDIDIEEELCNNYRVEQDMDKGELKFSLPDGEYSVYINGVFKKRKKKPRLSFTQARAITSELFRFETEDL